MKTIHQSVQALSNFLKDLPTNKRKISDDSRPKVLELLQECWPHLNGGDEQNTRSDKIYRAENLRWIQPKLHFELERHGATVNGSSRADVHHWEIDVDEGTAQVVKVGRRQLTKTAPRMDVRAKATEIADAILNGREHPSFNWDNNQEWVVITISEIIPETIPQTTQSRRKRFRDTLDSILFEQGWVRKNHGSKLGYSRA
ncbi:hypothetical protein [Methylomonas fluvii]|uniref:Uncharacterized protein n=1 Tax=Methylomonas fluvii TaxID=1854564 RepID=A0ABR9DF93_9GAMM|nr:hypothetical protein [Methylomonas fluvii]MBD9361759.1 hypothetical protein [Methylomonas fluvii]